MDEKKQQTIEQPPKEAFERRIEREQAEKQRKLNRRRRLAYNLIDEFKRFDFDFGQILEDTYEWWIDKGYQPLTPTILKRMIQVVVSNYPSVECRWSYLHRTISPVEMVLCRYPKPPYQTFHHPMIGKFWRFHDKLITSMQQEGYGGFCHLYEKPKVILDDDDIRGILSAIANNIFESSPEFICMEDIEDIQDHKHQKPQVIGKKIYSTELCISFAFAKFIDGSCIVLGFKDTYTGQELFSDNGNNPLANKVLIRDKIEFQGDSLLFASRDEAKEVLRSRVTTMLNLRQEEIRLKREMCVKEEKERFAQVQFFEENNITTAHWEEIAFVEITETGSVCLDLIGLTQYQVAQILKIITPKE